MLLERKVCLLVSSIESKWCTNPWVRDDLSSGADESCVKVQYDVDEENDIDDGVDDQEKNVLAGFVFEGDVVRYHNRGVKSQTKYNPVPNGLESAVVQQYVGWRLWGLLSVLWHHVPA